MPTLKHVGRVKTSNQKILVAFRTLPGESNQCLTIPVASLSDSYHDSIINLVETPEAQAAFEFGEILFTRTFSDGRPMLQALQADNIMRRQATDNIEMTPSPGVEVLLSSLNTLIAEQKNCTVDELYTFVAGAPKTSSTSVDELTQVDNLGKDLGEPTIPAQQQPLQAKNNEVLSDKDIAKSYRSQADAMYKEAARLRREADELDPPAKKAVKTKEEASA